MAETGNPHLLDFDLETLKHINGSMAFQQIQRLIDICVDDCRRRPGAKKARKVIIVLKIRPKTRREQDPIDGEIVRTILDGCGLGIESDYKIPKREMDEVDCGVSPQGRLLFNPGSPDNHRQIPLPMVLDQKSVAAGE